MSTTRASLTKEDSHSDEKNNKSEIPIPTSSPRVKKVSIILDSAPADMDKIKLNMADASSKQKSVEKHRSVFYIHKSDGDSIKLKSSDSIKRKSVGDSNTQDATNIPTASETSNELICDSSHDARQMMSVVFPVNIDVLVATLYSKSKTVLQFRELRKQSNIALGDWTANEDGTKSRTIKFTQALKKGLGPKASQVTELQVIRKCSKKGKMYSIDMLSWNEGIPYADTFYIMTHHCLVRIAENQTQFTAYAQLKFKKPQWGIIRSILERSVNDGLEENYIQLEKFLNDEFGPSQMISGSGKLSQKSQIKNDQTDRSLDNNNNKINGTQFNKLSHLDHTNKWLPWLVVVLIVIVSIMNIFLLFKLWSVEESLTARIQVDHLISSGDIKSIKSEEDWIKILRRQEEIHQMEITKWQELLETAVQMIRDTENTLVNLLHSVVIRDNGSK